MVGGLVDGLDVGLDDVGLLVLVELAVVVSTVVELELELELAVVEISSGTKSWGSSSAVSAVVELEFTTDVAMLASGSIS